MPVGFCLRKEIDDIFEKQKMKRKQSTSKSRPGLWQLPNGCYLAPWKDKVSSIFHELRINFPDIRVVFLRDWSIESVLMEMSFPLTLNSTSDYFIIPARDTDLTILTVGKYDFHRVGNQWQHKGSSICESCFQVGKLVPFTCFTHQKCEHSKTDRQSTCVGCISKTFAGHWKEEASCIVGVNPSDVARMANKNFSFKCCNCKHQFSAALNDVSQGKHWCPYCTNLKRCEDDGCKMCFENSFASCDKAKCWHKTKNHVTPRQIAKNDNHKYTSNRILL